MKLVCVNNTNLENRLTISKIYDVIRENSLDHIPGQFSIIDDNGKKSSYFSHRFKNLEDIRIEKLKSIGI